MAEDNKKTFPFQIRMYQNKIPEMLLNEVAFANHKVLPSLLPLLEKFPLVFLELEESGKLTAECKDFFKNLPKSEKLVVVAEKSDQVEFDLDPIPFLPSVQSAFLRLKHKKGIEAFVKKLALYPQLKSSVFEYLEILNEGEVGFQDLVKALGRDPELGQKILNVCNSMERSINNPFPDVTRAVSFVGVEGVRQILIEGAFTNLTHLFVKDQRDKLCHLRQASTLAGELGKLYDSSNPHIFWRMRSAALMHDIGSLVMFQYSPSEYEQCRNYARSKKISLYESEKIHFGFTHQEAGVLMADIMHLPKYLYPSISKHHNKEIDKNDILLQATVIANGFVNKRIDILGYRDYNDCFDLLEESKEAADKEKKDKEFAKLLSKIPAEDIEGRERFRREFYNLPDPEPETENENETGIETENEIENETETENKLSPESGDVDENSETEPTEEFKSESDIVKTFTSFLIEQLFSEKIHNVVKAGYELKMF